MIMLHRSLYRDCGQTRLRRLNWRPKVTDRLIDRDDQSRELISRNRMISDVTGDDFSHRAQSAAS